MIPCSSHSFDSGVIFNESDYDSYSYNKLTNLNYDMIIKNSWQRCKTYGLSPDDLFVTPIHNSRENMQRRKVHKELIDTAEPFMKTILGTTTSANFVISLINSDGYILTICGEKSLQEEFKKYNFYVGARWRESEVGTTAIVLSLIERIPIQLIGEQHYCKCYHNYFCSAVPLITESEELLGCLCISGKRGDISPTALGMTIAIGQAITKQVEFSRTLGDLRFANKCQEAIIDSIFSGFMIIGRNGYVAHINKQGAEIFGIDSNEAIGKHISEIVNSRPVILDVIKTGVGWADREFFIDTKRGPLRLIKTAIPVKNASGELVYVIETFREMNKVHEFATKVMGAKAQFTFNDVVGNSVALLKAIDMAATVAKSDSTILIQGETGTGKEVFAQAIHMNSQRFQGPYIAINCGSIPRDLLESELFGYVEGAFSGASKNGMAGKFELASGGTLLLDEIGEMPLDMQVKLLRVLQERVVMRLGGNKIIPVNVRIIAATNKNLEEEVEKGNFRQDLYYRLNVITVNIPPLRERNGDIPLLVKHFLRKVSSKLKKTINDISPEAMLALVGYSWPGNVRELENAVERAVNVCHTSIIELCDLPEKIIGHNISERRVMSIKTDHQKSSVIPLKDTELEILKYALTSNKWNISLTAKQLGISRTALYSKIKKHNLYEY